MQVAGEIAAFYKNIRTGRMTKIDQKKNRILFGGADVMAAVLAGDNTRRISHMYFEFENTSGTPTLPTITRQDGRAYFESIDGSGNRDWVKAPIVVTPSLSIAPNNSADYTGNTVMFTATTASVSPATGKSPMGNYFSDAGGSGPSKIFSIGLVSSPDPNNESKDKVFSRVNLSTAMPLQPNSHIVLFWSLKFN